MKRIITIILVGIVGIIIYVYLIKDNNDIKKIEYQITTTEIGKIMKDPRFYEGKTVTVSGEVENSFSVCIKFYSISDGTGTIYVRTDRAVPLKGELIKVKGKYNQFIKIGAKQYSTITENYE